MKNAIYLLGLLLLTSCANRRLANSEPVRSIEASPTASAEAVNVFDSTQSDIDYSSPLYTPEFDLHFVVFADSTEDAYVERAETMILEAVEFANAVCKDSVRFNITESIDRVYALPVADQMRSTFLEGSKKLRTRQKKFLDGFRSDTAVTVFVTGDNPDQSPYEGRLLGYTKMLVRQFHYFESEAPDWDEVVLAREGLAKVSTLAHELGHYLGLSHTWEWPDDLKEKYYAIMQSLIMNYVNHPEFFTSEELHTMRTWGLSIRDYNRAGILKEGAK